MTNAESVVALGCLTAGGEWVGILRSPGRWDLVFGNADGSVSLGALPARPDRTGLIAASEAYFSEALADPPPGIEATQADLAELIRWLAGSEPDRELAARLRMALEAVDDGLAGDVVAGRLSGGEANEQIDPLDLLVGLQRARAGLD